MSVAIPNFRHSYRRRGKPIFVPTSIGRRIGLELKEKIEAAYDFDPIYFHMKPGGHVAAIHHHREHKFFARIDIARFFYSVSRRRVQSAIDRVKVDNAAFYAKWSTVRNPYETPRFSLPYGFVQSPILASLVIATSDLGTHLQALPHGVKASVYMDDIALSAGTEAELLKAYTSTLAALKADGFDVSESKLRPPALAIDIFNCDLSNGWSAVRDERVSEFQANNPSPESEAAFASYCGTVEAGNATLLNVTQSVTQLAPKGS